MKSAGGRESGGEASRRISLGRAGESVARRFLEENGFEIIATNYRKKGGEADIIGRSGKLVVFFEVKTRLGSGDPVEGYGEVQQARLVKTCEAFIAENSHLMPHDYDLRFDLVVVTGNEDGVLEVSEHIPDAFRP